MFLRAGWCSLCCASVCVVRTFIAPLNPPLVLILAALGWGLLRGCAACSRVRLWSSQPAIQRCQREQVSDAALASMLWTSQRHPLSLARARSHAPHCGSLLSRAVRDCVRRGDVAARRCPFHPRSIARASAAHAAVLPLVRGGGVRRTGLGQSASPSARAALLLRLVVHSATRRWQRRRGGHGHATKRGGRRRREEGAATCEPSRAAHSQTVLCADRTYHSSSQRGRDMRQAAAAATNTIRRRAARTARSAAHTTTSRMQASDAAPLMRTAVSMATASSVSHSSAGSLSRPFASSAASFSTAASSSSAPPSSSSDARYASLLHTLLTINRSRKVRMGVETTRTLIDTLGPQFDLARSNIPVIHVAGSNGKGSVTLKIASALQAHGLRVGVYTSPHLSSFRERIAINGQMISQDEMCALLAPMLDAAACEDIPATFFELGTALAFGHFLQPDAAVDVAVLEVGLGGRLDSTNVLPRVELAVICSIALEHTDWLGDTLELIAREKAGILKRGCPALIGPSVPLAVVNQVAGEVGAGPVEQMRPEQPFLDYDDENSALATKAVHMLARDSPSIRALLRDSPQHGLNSALVAQAVKIRPPCRFQRVRWDPIEKRGHYIPDVSEASLADGSSIAASASASSAPVSSPSAAAAAPIEVVLDVCHNPAAFERLFEKLELHYGQRAQMESTGTNAAKSSPSPSSSAPARSSSFPVDVRAVVGFSSDKDFLSCLAMLMQRCSSVYVVQGDTPRAATAEAVMARAAEAGLQARFPHCPLSVWSPSPADTLLHVLSSAKAAVQSASLAAAAASLSPPPPPVVLCAGTFFIMSDVRAALSLPHPTDPVSINEQTLTNAKAQQANSKRA